MNAPLFPASRYASKRNEENIHPCIACHDALPIGRILRIAILPCERTTLKPGKRVKCYHSSINGTEEKQEIYW